MSKKNKVDYHKSCDKSARCNFKKCDPAECDNYKYNMKRFATCNEDIEVDMPDDQLVAVGADLVEAQDVINEADGVLASAKSKHKSIVDEQKEVISECISIMKKKTHTIEVKVEECRDHVAGTYTRSFTDESGEEEVLEERELTDNEKQQELDLINEANTPAEVTEPEEEPEEEKEDTGDSISEEMIQESIAVITEYRIAKAVTLQRKMSISAELAHKVLETLHALGHVGEFKGDGEPREILFELPENTGATEPETGEDKPEGEAK